MAKLITKLETQLDKYHTTKINTPRSFPASEIREEVLDEIIASKNLPQDNLKGTADYFYNPEVLDIIMKKNTVNFLRDTELSFKKLSSEFEQTYFIYATSIYKNIIDSESF
ncbi:MAG TPA: hypothetical protein VEC16_04670 [Alphaproteobacteria bacterium]|nr:hypothetical protein [Alphaproteobacteria bacterium]